MKKYIGSINLGSIETIITTSKDEYLDHLRSTSGKQKAEKRKRQKEEQERLQQQQQQKDDNSYHSDDSTVVEPDLGIL